MKKCAILFLTVLLITSFSFSQARKVRVIADRAPLYSDSKKTSAVLDYFVKGTVLNVLSSGEKNGWFYVSGRSVRLGGIISGFIQASEVEYVEAEPRKPAQEIVKEAPKIPEATKATEAVKPAEEKPIKTEEAAKAQEVKKPEDVKPAEVEEPAKPEEIAKPAEIPKAQETRIPAATERMPRKRVFSIRLGYNAGFASQDESVSWSKEVYWENAAYGINYAVQKGNSFNAGFGYKFSETVGVEIGVDIASRNLNASYDAAIPHPLNFGSPRNAESTASYKISENAVFLNGVLEVPLDRFSLNFFAGPAYFFSSAELIEAIQYSQSYPYSSVAISAQVQKVTQNVFGFDAGASLVFNFAQGVGVFLSGQYFTGSADFKPTEIPGIKLSLGGLKAGGGIKLSF